MASTIDERFERLVTEIVKNDVFNTHLEDEEVSF